MSEYLSEEEQVAKMKSWWDENGTALITGVVAAVAALFGWNWYGNYQQDQTYAASEAYVAYVEADGAGKAVSLTLKAAKIDKELQKKGTGALASMWAGQEQKIAAAVRIQAMVRGSNARRAKKETRKRAGSRLTV